MLGAVVVIAVSILFFLETTNHVVDCFLLRSHHGIINGHASSQKSLLHVVGDSELSVGWKDIRPEEGIPFEQHLLQCYLNSNGTETAITVEGYVLSKRSLGKQLVFVDLQINQVDSYNSPPDLCQALLKQEYYLNSNLNNPQSTQHYEGYRRCLLPGTLVRATGTAAPTKNPGNVVLLLQSMQITQLPRHVQHITTILQQCQKGNLPCEEIAKASGWSPSMLQERWKEISQQVQGMEATRLWQKMSKEMYEQLLVKPKTSMKNSIQNSHSHTNITNRNKGNPFVLPVAPDEWREIPKRTIDSSQSPSIAWTGWVQNRQRFQDNITLVTLILDDDNEDDDDDFADEQRLPCLLHPDVLQSQDAGLYRNLLAVGAQVRVQGFYYADNNASMFVVQQIRLLQSSDRPETIRYLLQVMADQPPQPQPQLIDMKEAAQALQLSFSEALNMTQSLDATERQWKANQLSAQLQQTMSRPQRIPLDPLLLRPLEKYRPVAQKYPVQFIGRRSMDSSSTSGNNNIALRTGVAGSRWMSQKKPQLEWMCQQIRSVLESHPDYSKRKLTILDIGGGQGFLANSLGQTMMDQIEQIHVVDICARAVHNGATRAQRLGTPVVFAIADASSRALETIQADVVVALHACGHLSDVALAHAVQRQAGFVIVPCCFNSNPHLKIPSSEETVEDWLGIPLQDWSALKKLAEVQGNIGLATQAMEMICAVRADAVQNKWKTTMDDECSRRMNVAIRQFPMEYSTRNTVLVGSFGGCLTF